MIDQKDKLSWHALACYILSETYKALTQQETSKGSISPLRIQQI